MAYFQLYFFQSSHGCRDLDIYFSIIIPDTSVGRTFGHNALKRLSFIFLPVMFTLGVISTLLMALAVISVKNLAIGVMLLIVAVSQVNITYFFFANTYVIN